MKRIAYSTWISWPWVLDRAPEGHANKQTSICYHASWHFETIDMLPRASPLISHPRTLLFQSINPLQTCLCDEVCFIKKTIQVITFFFFNYNLLFIWCLIWTNGRHFLFQFQTEHAEKKSGLFINFFFSSSVCLNLEFYRSRNFQLNFKCQGLQIFKFSV